MTFIPHRLNDILQSLIGFTAMAPKSHHHQFSIRHAVDGVYHRPPRFSESNLTEQPTDPVFRRVLPVTKSAYADFRRTAARRFLCACPVTCGDLRAASRPSSPPNHPAYRMGLRLVVGRGGGAGGGAPKASAFEWAQKIRREAVRRGPDKRINPDAYYQAAFIPWPWQVPSR